MRLVAVIPRPARIKKQMVLHLQQLCLKARIPILLIAQARLLVVRKPLTELQRFMARTGRYRALA